MRAVVEGGPAVVEEVATVMEVALAVEVVQVAVEVAIPRSGFIPVRCPVTVEEVAALVVAAAAAAADHNAAAVVAEVVRRTPAMRCLVAHVRRPGPWQQRSMRQAQACVPSNLPRCSAKRSLHRYDRWLLRRHGL